VQHPAGARLLAGAQHPAAVQHQAEAQHPVAVQHPAALRRRVEALRPVAARQEGLWMLVPVAQQAAPAAWQVAMAVCRPARQASCRT